MDLFIYQVIKVDSDTRFVLKELVKNYSTLLLDSMLRAVTTALVVNICSACTLDS